MLDPSVVTTLALAGIGAASTGIGWVIKLEKRLTVHEEADRIIHLQIAESLDDIKSTAVRMDAKMDRIVERWLPRV